LKEEVSADAMCDFNKRSVDHREWKRGAPGPYKLREIHFDGGQHANGKAGQDSIQENIAARILNFF
jgi:hypothetical protein